MVRSLLVVFSKSTPRTFGQFHLGQGFEDLEDVAVTQISAGIGATFWLFASSRAGWDGSFGFDLTMFLLLSLECQDV